MQRFQGLQQLKPGVNSALRIVFMGLRVAKIR
jgi:hypothetical protein